MKFPTGGKAREPYGMTRLDSEADSKVWMEEDKINARYSEIIWLFFISVTYALKYFIYFRAFYMIICIVNINNY